MVVGLRWPHRSLGSGRMDAQEAGFFISELPVGIATGGAQLEQQNGALKRLVHLFFEHLQRGWHPVLQVSNSSVSDLISSIHKGNRWPSCIVVTYMVTLLFRGSVGFQPCHVEDNLLAQTPTAADQGLLGWYCGAGSTQTDAFV